MLLLCLGDQGTSQSPHSKCKKKREARCKMKITLLFMAPVDDVKAGRVERSQLNAMYSDKDTSALTDNACPCNRVMRFFLDLCIVPKKVTDPQHSRGPLFLTSSSPPPQCKPYKQHPRNCVYVKL